MGIRKGINDRGGERGEGKEGVKGFLMKIVEIMGERWKIVGAYVNGDKWEKWRKNGRRLGDGR